MNDRGNDFGSALRTRRPRQVGVWLLGVTAFILLPVHRSSAVGTRLPNQDPEGIARGNAFAATADNPSAIYYNPAGIGQLEGQQARIGLYVISASTHYESPGGAKAHTDATPQVVPQFYYVNSLRNLPLSFGLGVYAPYGLSLDWGNNAPFNTLAERGQLLYASVNPVVAWRVSSNFSLAIGPTLNYSDATLRRGIGIVPGDSFRFAGNGLAFGFNAGLFWHPKPQWSFGVNYRSATTVHYEGHSETSPTAPFPPYYPQHSTHASLKFPQFIAAGVSYRPTSDWNIEADIDWTDWDAVNQVVFKGTPLGDIPFILNYESSFMYEFGVTRKLGKGYSLSVGYIYSENSSPSRYFNPIVPDANLHLGSIGISHHGERWDWAVAYHFAYNGGRQINNNVSPLVNGTYRTFNNAVNVSVTFKF